MSSDAANTARRKSDYAHERSTLPIELIVSILELSLIAETWKRRAAQLHLVLLVNRTTHTALARSAYHVVVLDSINAVELFYDAIEASPHLAGLVANLWIATPGLNQFDTSFYPSRIIETKIRTILSKLRSLNQVAVPYEYFPSTGFPRIKHLTTTNDLFPPTIPALPSLEVLHIHGLPSRNCVNTIISRFAELRDLAIDASLTPETDHVASLLCARMVLLFRQRLKNLKNLEIRTNTRVFGMLKTGLKKTLEEDTRICLGEPGSEPEGGNRHAGQPLYDAWLVYSGQSCR